MSDDVAGRYKRAYARIWRHAGFRKLTQAEQRLTLYLLTGPQTNRIGLFHFVVAAAAEDLMLGSDTLRKGLPNVCLTFGWLFDAEARIFYIPSWWRWNRPDNMNVLVGNLKDISEIPSCGLVDAFAANLTYVLLNLQETFIRTLRERLPQRSPTQEQEQEQEQEQVQEQDLKAAAPPHLVRQEDPDDNVGVITKLAHEVINQIGAESPDLTDAVKALCAQHHVAYNSGAVRKAIESAIVQRRLRRLA